MKELEQKKSAIIKQFSLLETKLCDFNRSSNLRKVNLE